VITEDQIKPGVVLDHTRDGRCVVKSFTKGIVQALVDEKWVPIDSLVVRQYSTGRDKEFVANMEGCLDRFTLVEEAQS
jgi:hypothetical protein